MFDIHILSICTHAIECFDVVAEKAMLLIPASCDSQPLVGSSVGLAVARGKRGMYPPQGEVQISYKNTVPIRAYKLIIEFVHEDYSTTLIAYRFYLCQRDLTCMIKS